MTKLAALARALGLGDDPQAILEPLKKLYADLDREITARATGLALPCKPGCDACCHESVFLSAPELLAVAAALLEKPREELARVVAEMRALAERYADELELLETIEPGPERDEVAARVKFRCPLLGPDGRCTIYEARELNARTFGAAYDSARGEPYGCTLTHERLRVLPPESAPALFDARGARRRLRDHVPGTTQVQVYPWWFNRYGHILLKD
jgi:Fe-S-cluster containining protein